MRIIEWKTLGEEDVLLGRPEVFPESWESRRGFALYKHDPRPCHALFFVKNDIRVSFFSQNGEELTAKKGDVLFIPQGSLYHVSVEGGTPGDIDTYTVNFTVRDSSGEILTVAERITLLCNGNENVLDMHFQKLFQAAHAGVGGSPLRLRTEFYDLLDALATVAVGHPDALYVIRGGAEALRNEWNRNEPIERYATLCNVSETYFYRCFREWCGQSPVEYRNALRISHAEAMLRHTDMQISEISGVVGFDDPFYFSRIFTKHTGLSPKAYRKASRDGSQQNGGHNG